MFDNDKDLQEYRKIVSQYTDRMHHILEEVAGIWLDDSPKANMMNPLDQNENRRRYVINRDELGSHYRFSLWYGNGKYIPSYYMDIDDNAWFLKTAVVGYCAMISMRIDYPDEIIFSISIEDICNSLFKKRYQTQRFFLFEKASEWIKNKIKELPDNIPDS